LLENGKPPSGKVKAARLFRSEGKGHVMTEMKEQPLAPLATRPAQRERGLYVLISEHVLLAPSPFGRGAQPEGWGEGLLY